MERTGTGRQSTDTTNPMDTAKDGITDGPSAEKDWTSSPPCHVFVQAVAFAKVPTCDVAPSLKHSLHCNKQRTKIANVAPQRDSDPLHCAS